MDIVGDLRLSPAISPLSSPSMPILFPLSPAISRYLHLPMILFPAISGYLPLSSPTYGFCTGYLRLSPAISRLSSRYLQAFASFFARVFICDGLISLHEMLSAGTENLLWTQIFGCRVPGVPGRFAGYGVGAR